MPREGAAEQHCGGLPEKHERGTDGCNKDQAEGLGVQGCPILKMRDSEKQKEEKLKNKYKNMLEKSIYKPVF